MKNIAKLTSYGSYLDCEFITAKYPDDKVHIVGDLAEYVYNLEQENKVLKTQTKLMSKNCYCPYDFAKMPCHHKSAGETECNNCVLRFFKDKAEKIEYKKLLRGEHE